MDWVWEEEKSRRGLESRNRRKERRRWKRNEKKMSIVDMSTMMERRRNTLEAFLKFVLSTDKKEKDFQDLPECDLFLPTLKENSCFQSWTPACRTKKSSRWCLQVWTHGRLTVYWSQNVSTGWLRQSVKNYTMHQRSMGTMPGRRLLTEAQALVTPPLRMKKICRIHSRILIHHLNHLIPLKCAPPILTWKFLNVFHNWLRPLDGDKIDDFLDKLRHVKENFSDEGASAIVANITAEFQDLTAIHNPGGILEKCHKTYPEASPDQIQFLILAFERNTVAGLDSVGSSRNNASTQTAFSSQSGD